MLLKRYTGNPVIKPEMIPVKEIRTKAMLPEMNKIPEASKTPAMKKAMAITEALRLMKEHRMVIRKKLM